MTSIMTIERTYIGRLLVSLDQLGNTIAGGYPDTTISARLFWLHYIKEVKTATVLMRIVDFVFKPVDGEGHCEKAYEDHFYKYYWKYAVTSIRRGNDISLVVMWLLTIPSLLLIYPTVLTIALYRRASSVS